MNRAFTLIETIVYIALLSILIGSSLLITYQILESSLAIEKETILAGEATFILKKIEWAMTGATMINSPASGASGSVLSITEPGFPASPIIFDVDSNILRISQNANMPIPLTTKNVVVQSFNVYHIAASSTSPEGADITITINNRPFHSIFYLRR